MSYNQQNDPCSTDVDLHDQSNSSPPSLDNIYTNVDGKAAQRVASRAEIKESAGKQVDEDSSSLKDKGNGLESEFSEWRVSSGDICRICHMGGFPGILENSGARETDNNQSIRRADSQLSTLSSFAYLGPLISACKCRGTVALVHAECLERWLTESGHTRCELCGYKYVTKRVRRHGIFRSALIWANIVLTNRQMLLDVLYLIVTTPLALFCCYICMLSLRLLIKSGVQNVPWVLIAILPTCFLTLTAYWGWVIAVSRIHGRRWHRYWRSNFVIRLLPENMVNNTLSEPPTIALTEPQIDEDLEILPELNNAEEFIELL